MDPSVVATEKTRLPRQGRPVLWAFQRPLHLERLALLAQRVSGVAILVYLFFHIFVTGTVTEGRGVWESTMGALSNPLMHLGEWLVVVAATFHAVNGIRVMLLELTPLVGKPARPDYPYEAKSLGKGQRSVLYVAMLMTSLAGLAGIVILWGL